MTSFIIIQKTNGSLFMSTKNKRLINNEFGDVNVTIDLLSSGGFCFDMSLLER